jgi:6-pyruvoyltetrahydropterin/6-carboxytetrahydropterin synthase
VNLKDLNKVINKYIIEHIDHKNINLEVDFMKGKLASTENMVISIWEQLDQPIKEMNAELHRIKLFESENNFVEYMGPNA